MLQINTGKFFPQGAGRTNQLRAVVYANINLGSSPDSQIQSDVFGKLFQTDCIASFPAPLVYEFDERLERGDRTPGVIFSHGAEPYVDDMATVVSFGLNCTCARDIDLVRRLVGDHSTSVNSPSRHVKRVFDRTLYCQPGEAMQFVGFTEKLLSLERKYYLAAMAAIRTFVTGLRRIGDDLDVAYTMLVAACESLAEGVEPPAQTWETLDVVKRSRFDCALTGAQPEVVTATREAVLFFEHAGLSRKFQEFVIGHVEPEYFCDAAGFGAHPVGRSDLGEVLQAAYRIRSKYVHKLARLPQHVSLGSHAEMVLVDRRMTLTLQGFARLARHAISTFVQRSPSVERETYAYVGELHGVIRARLGGAQWVASGEGDLAQEGRVRLEAFLQELEAVLMQRTGAQLPDVRDVIKAVAKRASTFSNESRNPYWALLLLFNSVVPEHAVSLTEEQTKRLETDFSQPSAESLLATTFAKPVPWPLQLHHEALQKYFAERGHRRGLRAPRLFEAAMVLELGERFRSAGDHDGCERLMREAADNFPDCVPLRILADGPVPDSPIFWQALLLPKPVGQDVGQPDDGA